MSPASRNEPDRMAQYRAALAALESGDLAAAQERAEALLAAGGEVDPSGGGDRIYNRYSYIYCEIPKGLAEASVSQISDTIYVLYLPPSLPALEDIGCRFVLFPDSGAESELYGFARVYENEKNGIFVYKRL